MCRGLCDSPTAEAIAEFALHNFEVTHTTRAGRPALRRFDGPIVAAACGTGIGTCTAYLFAHMIRMAPAAGAHHMGAPAALTHGGRTFGHVTEISMKGLFPFSREFN